jgi:hypothetical protein
MPAKRFTPRLIKLHRSYAIDEAARALGKHKNTVRGWIAKGLPTIDKARPTLINGHDLRRFLEGQRKARKRPCPPGTLYCFKCRAPAPPALGMIDYTPVNATTGNLSAFCGVCETVMHRRARFDSIAVKMPKLSVQIREAVSRLSECTSPSLNHDNAKDT